MASQRRPQTQETRNGDGTRLDERIASRSRLALVCRPWSAATGGRPFRPRARRRSSEKTVEKWRIDSLRIRVRTRLLSTYRIARTMAFCGLYFEMRSGFVAVLELVQRRMGSQEGDVVAENKAKESTSPVST